MVTSRRQFIRRGALFLPAVAGIVGCPSVTGQASLGTRRIRHRLLTNLSSNWHLDEESGSRVDARGNNNLTDNNTVGYTAGKLGNAAHCVKANNEVLTCSDSASLNLSGGVFTITAWSYHVGAVSASTYPTILGRMDTGQHEVRIYVSDAAQLYAAQTSVDGTAAQYWYTAAWAYSSDAWHFSCLRVNGTAVKLRLDDREDTYAGCTGVHNSTGTFAIGNSQAPTAAATQWNGYIDEVGLWLRALTDEEVAFIYNDGAGRRIV